jgi:hypothetical protein
MKHIPDPKRIEVVDDAMAAIYRSKTPAERIVIACNAHRTARLMLTARIQELHSNWSDVEVQKEVARRLLLGAN